jgi:hypothetical protein
MVNTSARAKGSTGNVIRKRGRTNQYRHKVNLDFLFESTDTNHDSH